MRRAPTSILLAVGLVACSLLAALASPPTAGAQATGWSLIWADEFAGQAGSVPDPSKWRYDTGYGWGQGELQAYTDRTHNASLDGQGNLAITARRERYTGGDGKTGEYTSARLNTRERFSVTYGRVEARIRVPSGQGIWPAFWMLGDDIFTKGWPDSGEIDIMEVLGQDPATLYGSIHGPRDSDPNGYGITAVRDAAGPLSSGFHLFGVEWSPQRITVTLDGNAYRTFTPDDLPADGRWVFDHPHHLILNIAVGGSWPGPPDHTTRFPATMLVDWVRVWKKQPPTGPDPSEGATASPAAVKVSRKVVGTRRKVRGRLRCRASQVCAGKAVLRLADRRLRKSGQGKRLSARIRYSMPPGAKQRLNARLTRRGRKLLSKRSRVNGRLTIRSAQGAAPRHVRIRLVKRGRGR